MYEESSCFDPNGMVAQDCFSQMVSKSEAVMSMTSMQPQNTLGMENLAYTSASASAVMSVIGLPSLGVEKKRIQIVLRVESSVHKPATEFVDEVRAENVKIGGKKEFSRNASEISDFLI
ncbi:hypothetical protein LR48_Vigan03g114600 [Vigna angularis]|uniref:Uncharacterized protein n=1 Tax=Phaseolus angularis TaxID=3914 RepID=A0A0L9U5Q9_PHAAN|nr:hypothetical protein LR48_Vigan03g114600 [Vigna angularis]